jgi:hypothetical protein
MGDALIAVVLLAFALIVRFGMFPLMDRIDPRQRQRRPGVWAIQQWLIPGFIGLCGILYLIAAIAHA